MSKEPLNLEQIRAHLAEARGQRYWRSLDELAATPEFQEFLHREFPRQASEWIDPSPISRRNFLKLMGASLALAGLSGCSIVQPQ
jgi:molybdopterin-containing oxidoreductase family iron-sulfur binding subunit